MKKFLTAVAIIAGFNLAAVNIFLAGDSTMCDYDPALAPQTGWGQALKKFAKPGVVIHNLARGGRSSKSFRDEGRWDIIMKKLQPGDFVLIQFGHNDAHPGKNNLYRFADPDTDYPANLRRYVRDVRAKGGIPIILSPTPFCIFENGKAVNTPFKNKYVVSARRAAEEENAAFIDHNAWALAEMNRRGEEQSKKLFMYIKPGEFPFYPKGRNDEAHLREYGADLFARGVIQLAARQNLPLAQYFDIEK